ncbi:MAG: hypothetical protein II358_04605, partial [Tidjanibacter sp.]|nr:hypothetical protein [Tidjanibacter sp.]
KMGTTHPTIPISAHKSAKISNTAIFSFFLFYFAPFCKKLHQKLLGDTHVVRISILSLLSLISPSKLEGVPIRAGACVNFLTDYALQRYKLLHFLVGVARVLVRESAKKCKNCSTFGKNL